jgi:hypothetical protein
VVNRERLTSLVEGFRVTAVEAGVDEAMIEREEIQEDHGERGEREGGMLESAVRVEEFGAHHAHSGMRK